MSDEALTAAVAALDVAIFEQRPDGGFTSVGQVPAWFRTFGQSATFPFLGSFLDEARAFWLEPHAAPLKWGPCAEIDEDGRQLQFMVSAVSSTNHKFLIFELNRDADEMQRTLQRAREHVLMEQAAAKDIRTCATVIGRLAEQLRAAHGDAERNELLDRISSASDMLRARLDGLLGGQARG